MRKLAGNSSPRWHPTGSRGSMFQTQSIPYGSSTPISRGNTLIHWFNGVAIHLRAPARCSHQSLASRRGRRSQHGSRSHSQGPLGRGGIRCRSPVWRWLWRVLCRHLPRPSRSQRCAFFQRARNDSGASRRGRAHRPLRATAPASFSHPTGRRTANRFLTRPVSGHQRNKPIKRRRAS